MVLVSTAQCEYKNFRIKQIHSALRASCIRTRFAELLPYTYKSIIFQLLRPSQSKKVIKNALIVVSVFERR